MNGGQLPTNQLHYVNWSALNHASHVPQLMSCKYTICVCVHVCVCIYKQTSLVPRPREEEEKQPGIYQLNTHALTTPRKAGALNMTVYFPYLHVRKLLCIFQTKKLVSELIDLYVSFSSKDDATTKSSFPKHMKLAGLCLEVCILFPWHDHVFHEWYTDN